MISAIALSELDLIPSPVPNVALTARDEVATEVRRLARLYWQTCRARGLGDDTVSLPTITVRREVKRGITGLCNHTRGTVTISIGTATWSHVVECLIHELCHALEPWARHGPRFVTCLSEAVDAIFGVDIDPVWGLGRDPYDLDRRIVAELEDRFAWARASTPETGTPFDFVLVRLRRSARARGAELVAEDLDRLRLAGTSEQVNVRGRVRIGDDVHTLTWKMKGLGTCSKQP